MSTTPDRILALFQDIAAWLRAAALDEDETLSTEERRLLIDIALEVERKGQGSDRQRSDGGSSQVTAWSA